MADYGMGTNETTPDSKKVYQMPALNYEEAFREVCKVVDEHPELWSKPSREAVMFAVNELWRKPRWDAGSERRICNALDVAACDVP
jgi:hypothetical protein